MLSKKYLMSKVEANHTILLHGGGNFGDLYRLSTSYRNFIIKLFPQNQIIIFPQTINYNFNKSLIGLDNQIYSSATNMTIMLRSFESLEFARKSFPSVNNVFVPDVAFMIGDTKPLNQPSVDIFFLRRTDNEKVFDLDNWIVVIKTLIGDEFSYEVNILIFLCFLNLLLNLYYFLIFNNFYDF